MKTLFCVIFVAVQWATVDSWQISRVLGDFVENQLYLGYPELFNTTRKDCVWRDVTKHEHLCPKEVQMELLSNGQQEKVDTTDKYWLTKSTAWDRNKENVFFVHGYASGDNAPPKYVMQDSLEQSNRYNAFILDYGRVSRAPCYVQMAQNYHYVSHCLASFINTFVKMGMRAESVICIGHSMGAQICGRLKKHLRFRLKKIIGLDPALPLIRRSQRLSHKDAESVHIISTNAGYYGDVGAIGHVDVCVNNGLVQPFCLNEKNVFLCSHLWALCFAAQSLFSDYQQQATRCTQVCPRLNILQSVVKFKRAHRGPDTILWGLDIPKSVRGSYCMSAPTPPFCPKYLNGFGSERCCDLINMFKAHE